MADGVDVCVYGATPAGCVAAVAARQEGASVVVVEPSRWVGGILGAGIKPLQDCPEPDSIGGLTRAKVLSLPDTPPAIQAGFYDWLREEHVHVIYEHRLESLSKCGDRIRSACFSLAPPDRWGVPAPNACPSLSAIVNARVFVDATYEGDLMAAAGVEYRTGRESTDEFGEGPAGVGALTNWTEIDPYVEPGRPESGLLPMIESDHMLPLHAGDSYTQAYNFRVYFTIHPGYRVPLTPPEDYRAEAFELVGRYVERIVSSSSAPTDALRRLSGIFPGWLNEGDFNYQRDSLVSIAPLGVSRFYQDADWVTRSAIWREHIDYLRGLHHFLSSDPRVPAGFRKRVASIGLDRRMHPETEGWPHQLYVRVARRMKGRYTLTHADVMNRTSVDDGVGLALYGVDIYPARRIACLKPASQALGVATEGNMWLGGDTGTGQPYAVPYRAITPEPSQCGNLLVPVCLSATHIAYASIRMEPVFCVLGESAGVAAAHAARHETRVQDIDLKALRNRLSSRGQVLTWPVS